MSLTGSNPDSNAVESWVEQRRIMGRTGSNYESSRFDRVEPCRTMSGTLSNHESHKIAAWVVLSRNIANLGRAKSQNGSRKFATWVAQRRNMDPEKLKYRNCCRIFCLHKSYTDADCKIK